MGHEQDFSNEHLLLRYDLATGVMDKVADKTESRFDLLVPGLLDDIKAKVMRPLRHYRMQPKVMSTFNLGFREHGVSWQVRWVREMPVTKPVPSTVLNEWAEFIHEFGHLDLSAGPWLHERLMAVVFCDEIKTAFGYLEGIAEKFRKELLEEAIGNLAATKQKTHGVFKKRRKNDNVRGWQQLA